MNESQQDAAVVAAAGLVIPPPVTRSSPYQRRVRHLSDRLTAFIDAEVQLTSRHHGPKRRWDALTADMRTLVDVDAAVVHRWVEWAVTGEEMKLIGVSSRNLANAVARTWVDGFSY